MPARQLSSASQYRYGFNGMEKDDEVKGDGNSYTSNYRAYDPRIGRWMSIDPKFKLLPNHSPYVNNNDNPIIVTDPRGDFGWIGAAIGAVVGAVVEVGSQAISNAVSGKPPFEKIDWADVGIAAGEGALIGSGVGLIAAAATKIGSAVLKTTIDANTTDGFVTAGGVFGTTKKETEDLVKDGFSNGAGLLIGGINLKGGVSTGFDVADKVSKNVIRRLSGSASPGLGNVSGKLFAGELAGGLVESTLIGGTIGGLIENQMKNENSPGITPGSQPMPQSCDPYGMTPTPGGGYINQKDADANGYLKKDSDAAIDSRQTFPDVNVTPQ